METTYRTPLRIVITLLATLSLLASQVAVFSHLNPANADVFDNTLPFEIDGNAVTDNPGSMIDWDRVSGATYRKDPLGDPDDIVFTQGSKEHDQSTWSVERKEATPAKSDLERTFAAGGVVDGDPHLYFGFVINDPGQQPSFSGNMEFNQSKQSKNLNGLIDVPIRTTGDILVAVDYGPNSEKINIYRWSGTTWQAAPGAATSALNATTSIDLPAAIGGGQAGARRFIETSVNLGELFETTGCLSFGQAFAKTRTSGGNPFDATLVDLTETLPVEINFCGEVTLRKTDTNGNGLAGAELALYEGEDHQGALVLSCTTGADGYCPDPAGALKDLEPGLYTAYETAPPAGFKLSTPRSQTIQLGAFGSADIVFENPPISYRIEVTPDDDTNAVGYTHDFEVELFADFVFDHDDGTYVPSEDADIPLAGETIDLSWSGPGASAIVAIDGSTLDPARTETSCTTDEDGTCIVTVLSDTIGSGTLTASYDTPLAGPAATDPANATNGGYFSSISDSGDKGWIGYRAELEGHFDNPLGVDHTFTAKVWQVNEDGTEVSAEDVEVSFGWERPDGSDLEASSCTTGADGECTVTVTSPDEAGTGTLEITQVEGDIVEGETLTITYDEDAPSATKTWWDYRATIDGDSTNPVGEQHAFVVTVERTDGSGWQNVPDGTTLDVDWEPQGDNDSDISENGCADPGTNSGTCTVTVTTKNVGRGVLTVDGIEGTTLFDYLDGERFEFEFAEAPQASKLWVDWEASISHPAENPAGEEHTFTVSVQVYDGEGYVDVPDGTTVGLTLSASDLDAITVVEDTCADPGTVGSECTLTVVADKAIVLDVSVTTVDDTVIDDGGDDRHVSFEFADPVDSKKEWIEYRIDDDHDAYNLTGDPHDFTLTAEQRREGGDWEPLAGVKLDVSLAAGSVGTMDASDCTEVGTADDGTCTVTVASSTPGSATVIAGAVNGIELPDGRTSESTTTWDVDVDAAAQTKTWLEYDVTVSGDAVNNLGDDHDFTVSVTVDDGSGAVAAEGATVGAEFTYDGGDTLDELECTTDAAGECTITVPAPVDGDADPVAGSGELVLAEVSHTFGDTDFTVDLTGELGLGADFEQPRATKDWIDYTLLVTPPNATNLLPDYPEHTFTVTLSSSDSALAPYAGQHIDLDLDSEVASIVRIEDATGTRTFDVEEGVVSESCTTTDAGDCDVTVVSSTPGTADLTASFSTEIGDAEFDLSAAGSKLWTTFRVSVNPQNAQNLLGTPHVFTVTIEQTNDGVTFTPVAGAEPTLSISAPAFIVDHDCEQGTAADGTCTATVDSEAPGVFTFRAEYQGVIGDQSAAFSASGDKGWIDYQVEVSPDVAENLTGTEHEFTVVVRADIGAGWEPVSGAMPDVQLAGPGTIIDEDCSDGTDEDGTCTVTIRSAVPGLTELVATYTGAAGGGNFDNPVETADYADSGLKLWVDYGLTVTPGTAINALNDPHTYTVTLLRDEGGEPFGVAGQTLDLTIDGPGEITGTSDGTIDVDGRAGTCTTDDDGTCEVTIVSDESGTTTLTASYGAVVGDTTGTFTASAEKHWAAIDLVKTALIDEDDDGFKTVTYSTDPDVDAPVITYQYTITNIGPVDLTVTELRDDVLGVIALPDALVLEPGQSTTVTADHVVTAEDAAAGDVYNVADVRAEADDGTEVTDHDDEQVFVITVLASGSIDLIKSALVERDAEGNKVLVVDAGEQGVITYRYRITNNGNVPLSDLSLVDDKIGDIPLPDGTVLEPGESITVDVDYDVSSADLAAGEVENVAVVTGVTPDGLEVTDQDDETVALVEVLEVVHEKPVVKPTTLPRTGVDSALLTALGLALTALGAAALLFTPRRRREGA